MLKIPWETIVLWYSMPIQEPYGWYLVAVASNDPESQWMYEYLWYNCESPTYKWWTGVDRTSEPYQFANCIRYYAKMPQLPQKVKP